MENPAAFLDILLLGVENEVVEFKEAKSSFLTDDLGRYVSALSNEARLRGMAFAWIVFGIKDSDKSAVGTGYLPKREDLEKLKHDIALGTSQHTFYEIYDVQKDGKRVIMFQIPPAPIGIPVAWKGHYYGRSGSSLVALAIDKIERIRAEGRSFSFELEYATAPVSANTIVDLLDCQLAFTRLFHLNYPQDPQQVVQKLIDERLVLVKDGQQFITNVAALLFAKRLNDFPHLSRKSIRITSYEGLGKYSAVIDRLEYERGYALDFDDLMGRIQEILPHHEVFEKATRKVEYMYPDLVLKEAIANALIHQDLSQSGAGPLIEVFGGRTFASRDSRIEILNPGVPKQDILKCVGTPSSRNEILAKLMRRMNFCEESGTGIIKILHATEAADLPSPKFETQDSFTRVTIYGQRPWKSMVAMEKVYNCYTHAILCHADRRQMTNESLRVRLKIEPQNSAMVSRIISDAIGHGLIKPFDPNSHSRKYASYIPNWA